MGFHFVPLVALLCLAVVGSCYASMPAELYWKSVFPNTPMPKSLKDLLRPVNKNNFVKLKDDIDPAASRIPYGRNEEFKSTDLEDSNRNHELKSGSHLTGNLSIFFFESDILPGRLMNLPGFTETENQATFLPRAVADSMPFSSNKFSDILKLFSMEPKQVGTKVMKQNIENCERAAMEGEDKYCATSLESLIDLSVSRLGKKIQALSTEVEKTKVEKFTVGKAVTNVREKNIMCHKMKYPYAVFLCHSIDKTDVYKVPLIGSDRTKVKAIAVCHKDTSTWNPKHLAFQVLKVKPGSVPICHFLAKEAIVWVPN